MAAILARYLEFEDITFSIFIDNIIIYMINRTV